MNSDWALAALIALAAGSAAWAGFQLLSAYIANYSIWDYWFEAEPPAVAEMMTDRWSQIQHRLSRHPLFSLVAYPPVEILRRAGLSATAAVGVVVASTAALWSAIFFFALRAADVRKLDAALFTALASVSAAAVFWFTVPESFALGAVSIAAALLAVAVYRHRADPPIWILCGISVATASFTTTNWSIGLAMLLVLLGWRRASGVALLSAAATAVLWTIQKLLFPFAGNPLVVSVGEEQTYLFNEESLGILAKLRSVLFHSVVLPTVDHAHGFRLSVQGMLPGEGGIESLAAVALWGALLLMGIYALWGARRQAVAQFIALALLGQITLHAIFGVETFMYSAHFGPLLVFACALATLTPLRPAVLVVGSALLAVAAVNNLDKFRLSADDMHQKYELEKRFAARVGALTSPSGYIVCGREAAAAIGEASLPRAAAAEAPLIEISFSDYPGACMGEFDDVRVDRRGWIVRFEDWSLQDLEIFRQRGARYFVTPYAFGIENRSEFFRELDRRYRRIERTAEWAFYDLDADRQQASR